MSETSLLFAVWHFCDMVLCRLKFRLRRLIISGCGAETSGRPGLTQDGLRGTSSTDAPAPHSITSSARTGSEGGMVKLSALRRPTTVGFASKRAGVPCCAH